MTDYSKQVDHNHPLHEGASGNIEVVREALAWSQKRQADLLSVHGATKHDVNEWREAVGKLTEELLQKVQDRRK